SPKRRPQGGGAGSSRRTAGARPGGDARALTWLRATGRGGAAWAAPRPAVRRESRPARPRALRRSLPPTAPAPASAPPPDSPGGTDRPPPRRVPPRRGAASLSAPAGATA